MNPYYAFDICNGRDKPSSFWFRTCNLTGQKTSHEKISGESVYVRDIGKGILLLRINNGS